MQLITRSQWGARPRGKGAATPFQPRGCTVHWEGAGWGWPWDHSTCDNKVRAIQDYHMDGRGWSDIAYNFLACPHGYVFEGRGLNRRSAANGDTTVNTYWYAVQCMWGTRSGSAPEALLTAARDAIDYCRSDGGAGDELRGHRDMQQTDCPGDQIYAWVRNGAPRPRPTPPPPPAKDWFDMATKEDLQAVVQEVVKKELAALLPSIHSTLTNPTNGVPQMTWAWNITDPIYDKPVAARALLATIRRDTGRAASYSLQALNAAVSPDKLAEAIVAKLPTGGADAAAVEAALRKVLGSLDEE